MCAKQGIKGAFRQSWIVWLGLFFLMPSTCVLAQEIAIGERRLYLQEDLLRLDIKLDSLFSHGALDAIESGMTTSVTLEFRLESERRSRILEKTLEIRVDHDIWEGRYRVVRQTSMPDTLRTADFKIAEQFCSDLHGIVLGAPPPGIRQFILRARIAVNPISPEQRQRTRKWLNLLEQGSLLELFISLDRPSERTRWIEVGRFSPEGLQ